MIFDKHDSCKTLAQKKRPACGSLLCVFLFTFREKSLKVTTLGNIRYIFANLYKNLGNNINCCPLGNDYNIR